MVRPWTRFRAGSLLALLLSIVPLGAEAQQPYVSLSSSHGALPANAPRDWLLDPFPLFVTPDQAGTSVITINPTNPDFPAAAPFVGRIRVTATCCGIPGAPGFANPGLDVRIGPSLPQAVNWKGTLPTWLIDRLALGGRGAIALTHGLVDMAGAQQQVTLAVNARPGAVSGNWIVWIGAEDSTGRALTSIPLVVNVLDRWPATGPAPRCMSNLTVLDLSAIRPTLHASKAARPADTSHAIGAVVQGNRVGMQFTIRRAAVSPALAPNQAIVRFKNSQGWPVGIRNSDSRDCATVRPTLTAQAGGEPATLFISTADTTTLVFSKSTCRFSLLWCWSIGLDDVVQLSEGAFWPLFGGREVEIETVRDWGNEFNWGNWVFGGVF
jgi:hypothetical protein